jgi:hypothetical protein
VKGNRDRLLIAAVASGNVKECCRLLDHGADANAKDAEGTPALNIASQLGILEIASVLLEHGADTESTNTHGATPLIVAAFEGHIAVMRLLLEKAANREACAQGETAFSVAAQLGHQEIMELLVPLSELARALLSNSNETSDAAIGRVLELTRSGSGIGLKALEESICWTRGKQITDFYTPGLRALDGWSALDEAPKKLLALARQKALWTTPPKQVQELISLCQVGGTDMRALLSTAKELGCDQLQVRAIQLLGLHLAAQVILSRVGRGETAASVQSPEAKEGKIIVVPRHETENKDCAPVLSLLKSLMASPKMARAHRQGVDILFGGYDDDPRPIWQIPDIRQYASMLSEQFPYWLFFMSDILPNFAGLVRCLMPLNTREEERKTFVQQVLLPQWVVALNKISEYAGMTESEEKEILERSMRYLIVEVVIKD